MRSIWKAQPKPPQPRALNELGYDLVVQPLTRKEELARNYCFGSQK